MRFVYMDEAGTSNHEPITIVVGVIVHADTQLMYTLGTVQNVLGHVPEEFQKDFVFHATNVWNDHKYRLRWSLEDRLELLLAMMRIPRAMGLQIVWAAVPRNSSLRFDLAQHTLAQWHHIFAFHLAVTSADEYMRQYAGPREVASIVAENIPEMQKLLLGTFLQARHYPWQLQGVDMFNRQEGVERKKLTRDMKIERIVDVPHFMSKRGALLVADACAFGLRRFFAGLSHGESMATAIFGHEDDLSEYSVSGSPYATGIRHFIHDWNQLTSEEFFEKTVRPLLRRPLRSS